MSGQLKYKMNDYEVVPPKTVWDSIVNELDERQSLASLAEKLAAYEVTPPATVWRHILTNLEKSTAVRKEVSIKTRFSSKVRTWLSAAAILIFLFTGSYYLLNKSDRHKSDIAGNNTLITTDEEEQSFEENYNNAKNSSTSTVVRLAHYSSIKKYSTLEDEFENLQQVSIEGAEPIILNEPVISITPRPILNAKGELIQDLSVINPDNNKYISITAPNGEQTQISAKLACALQSFGADNKDPFLNNCNAWQQRVNEWRQKVIHSGLVPSSTNFLDILEFTELIEEN